MNELSEKLKNEVDDASWEMLADHHERGAVFLISQDIDLLEAGVAFAQDDKVSVAGWLKDKKLLKVDNQMAKDYASSSKEKKFQFLIIQPYVLIQHKILN